MILILSSTVNHTWDVTCETRAYNFAWLGGSSNNYVRLNYIFPFMASEVW